MFEARLMKKRLELGLPLIQAPNLGALARDVQAKYQQFLVEAAQETGELFLASGDIPKAWPYLRATGDVQRVAAAIETVDPGENVEAIIEIAFMQGVHPAKGLELVIGKIWHLQGAHLLRRQRRRERSRAMYRRAGAQHLLRIGGVAR